MRPIARARPASYDQIIQAAKAPAGPPRPVFRETTMADPIRPASWPRKPEFGGGCAPARHPLIPFQTKA